MKGYGEKLMKVFCLRSAFQRHCLGSMWWSSFKKGASSTSSILLVCFFVLISLLAVVDWIDLAKYAGYSFQKFPKYSTKKPTNALKVPLDCATWNLTRTCPRNYPNTYKPSANPWSRSTTCPEYFRWIHEDLRHWKQTGITKEMVETTLEKIKHQKAHLRLTILDGKIYTSKNWIGNRSLITLWGIVQLARRYPGKLPNLELIFDTGDRPFFEAKDFRQPDAVLPPLFRYCSSNQHLDIVFPDWMFWGCAETNIKPWRSVLKDIKEGCKKIKWEDRLPYAYWKGNPVVAEWRRDLLKCNVTPQTDWNARLYVVNWLAKSKEESKKSKEESKKSNLENQCTHRYKIYIEGYAWSVSDKYILACNSPTLVMTQRYYDFFTRSLIPQHHYWPIRDNDKCRSIKFAVEWGNNHTEKAKAIGEAGSGFIYEDLKMDYVYDYMFHLLNKYGKLMKYTPSIPPESIELCSESLSCSVGGKRRKFMDESLEAWPSTWVPCTMPPPYEPQELKAFVDGNVEATQQVEAWEKEYWYKLNRDEN